MPVTVGCCRRHSWVELLMRFSSSGTCAAPSSNMRLVLRGKASKPVPGKSLQVPHPKDAVSSSAVRAYLQTPCSLSNPIKALLSFPVPAIVAPAACKSLPSPICLLLSWVLWLPLLYSPGLPRNETHSGLDPRTPMAIGKMPPRCRVWSDGALCQRFPAPQVCQVSNQD